MSIKRFGRFNYAVPDGHLSICVEGGLAFEADRRVAATWQENPLPGRSIARGLRPTPSERRQRTFAGHPEELSVHSVGELWAQALDRKKGKGQILLHFRKSYH